MPGVELDQEAVMIRGPGEVAALEVEVGQHSMDNWVKRPLLERELQRAAQQADRLGCLPSQRQHLGPCDPGFGGIRAERQRLSKRAHRLRCLALMAVNHTESCADLWKRRVVFHSVEPERL